MINNKPRLLLATTNKGKRRELADLLSSLDIDLVFPDQLMSPPEVDETGATYAENALLKARTLCEKYGIPALADDTGLEVDALEGRPGLHSARYLPDAHATDADRRRQLIIDLSGKDRPWTARFVCSVAIVLPAGEFHLTEGEIRGEIQPEERGEDGFGYDRIFYIPAYGKTMAELNLAEKNQCSHRARAVKAAIPWLEERLIRRRE